MHPLGSQLLSSHYAAIGWEADNDYAQLTKPTRGIHFSLGKLPAHQFANSASLSVLSPPCNSLPNSLSPYPTLTGSVSYVASSINSFQFIPTRLAALTTVVDRFAVPSPPINKSIDSTHTAQDYLLYGRFHLPTYRLDGLCSYQFSPTLQGLATLVSIPSTSSTNGILSSGNPDNSPTNQHMNGGNGIGGPSIWNLMLSMNHDTGKWSQQYKDVRMGHRITLIIINSFDRRELIDEDEVMDNVLKGRFSVGGELYFSALRKSAGVSTGIRFCTIPDPPGSILTQQPTVINATLNPIMGQISTLMVPKSVLILLWLQVDPLQFKTNDQLNGTDLNNNFTGMIPNNNNSQLVNYFWRTVSGVEDTLSILRARVSPVTGLTLMWEGRWKECLIGIGIQSEFLVSSSSSSTSTSTRTNHSIQSLLPNYLIIDRLQSPLIKGICLELQYTTDN
ncbi:hypothetical protein H4Q26_000695 [Puccinia striiformis f. sp. tritici PST-130]|nr:hypothetical protein H4Q26_000695 [Puccinia striiformis f. sp. tritici PST-130]